MLTRWRRLSHDQRVVILTLLAGLPGVLVSLGFLWLGEYTPRVQWTASVVLVGLWGGVTRALREQIIRPLGTLANMLAALREGDFSIRARVTDGSDALSLAYLEVNQLEEVLRNPRLGAVAATLGLAQPLAPQDADRRRDSGHRNGLEPVARVGRPR